MFKSKKALYIFSGILLVLLIPGFTYAHWYCYGTQAVNYETRPVATSSISYNSNTNKITLVIEGKICKQTPWSSVTTTNWLFGKKADVCTSNFSTGECGIGGYGDRKCCWHLNPVAGVWPSQYDLNPSSSEITVGQVSDSRCPGNAMWVITRTIKMSLSDYNNISGNGRGFVMGFQTAYGGDNYKTYPSEFVNLAKYSPPPVPALNVSCLASPNPANTDQLVHFNPSISGGTGSYNYSWTGACTGSSRNCSVRFPNEGTYTARISVTSRTQTKSASCSVNVNEFLNVSCSSSPNPANTNQTVIFSSSASGSIGSYIYSWSGACTGSSQSCSNTFSNPGTYTATVSVTSGTKAKSASCPVVISQPCTSHFSQQCYNNDLYWYDSCGSRQELYQDCGDDSWTNNYQCSGNWQQRQKTDRGCSNNACYQTNSWANHQDCSLLGQMCQNNQCYSSPTLNVSCSASPNPANTNQTVTFNSSTSGGTGSHIYSWTGACTGSSQNCSNSFSASGTYTVTVNVTSGSQTGYANCSVNINNQNINHAYKQCYNNDVYWYDSQGVMQEMYQDCGDDSWTNNYQCSGSNWLQRQKTIRWCSGESCQQSLSYENYQDCGAFGQTCQNNQCGGQWQNRYLSCYDNDVYWYDYASGRQEKYQDCGDSYCTNTGSNYCVGNSVYSRRVCYNKGCASNACYSTTSYSDNQFVQTCAYGQICQNGYCTSGSCECTSGPCCDGCHYKNTSSVCNTETQQEYGCPWGSACGSDVGQRIKTRNQYCSGYSASCTGAWSLWTGLSNWTLVDSCSTNETCFYGNSTCQPKSGCGGSSYILHYAKRCYDSDLYWYDSNSVRQDKYRDCEDTNECTVDSCFNNQCQNELRCDGATCAKGSADYCNTCDYCGDGSCNCGETISSCQKDCQIIGLALTLFGKKEKEAVQWLKSFSVGSAEKIDFLAVVSNGENMTMDNVMVRVDFPQEILYGGELTLEGVPYNGDIRTGITLGSLAPGITKTIVFKGEVVSESSISRSMADVVATITTSGGSMSDNIQITLLRSAQLVVAESEGFLAGLLKTDLNKPIYILLGLVLVILILMGFSRIMRRQKLAA